VRSVRSPTEFLREEQLPQVATIGNDGSVAQSYSRR
jgi:hypothetical protein